MIEQAIILAGGRGLRLREFTESMPKALVPLGGRPIIDYVLHHLSLHAIKQVTIAGGYRYQDLQDHGLAGARFGLHIDLVDTGEQSNTGGRIKAAAQYLASGPFLLCWCDGLSNFDFGAMLAQHESSSALVTLGAVNPPARFGEFRMAGHQVIDYAEKPPQADRWISAGYFVVEAEALSLINGPESSWERDVLTVLSSRSQLQAYPHRGRWQCMDTLQEQQSLNGMLERGEAFWPIPQ